MNTLINKKFAYAIIGASNNTQKYGHKIFKHFLEAGFNVLPVNLRGGEILGQKVYKDLDEVSEKIDVVVFVVPSNVTEKIIKDIKKHNIKKVWLQPGSENDNVISFCEENNIECHHSTCIMLEHLKFVK